MSKYRNRPVIVDGERFDSQAEYARWAQLRLLERAGTISGLQRQVPYELAPSVVIQGRKRPPLRYIADYVYDRDGQTVVEDRKGAITDAYRIKRHLMRTVHGIEILET